MRALIVVLALAGCPRSPPAPLAGPAEPASEVVNAEVGPADLAGDVPEDACAMDRAFRCATLEVPWDPALPDAAALPLAYAVRPADGPARLGALLIVDGGPGVSGLDGLDDLEWLDPALKERFDLVYFDMRGTRRSGGFYCRDATSDWYAGGQRAVTEEEASKLHERAATFGAACVGESGWASEDVATLTTVNAAADLERLRAHLGYADWTLYGVSYGSQLAQEYARTWPERARAVVLDGVVDLTLRDLDFAEDVNRTANALVETTLSACEADAACREALADPRAALGSLVEATARAPLPVAFRLADGTVRDRTFTRGDLDALLLLAMDDPKSRTWLLRALAAWSERQDPAPLRALLDAAAEIDPTTERFPGGSYSDAVYYAVTCNDYGRPLAAEWTARALAQVPDSPWVMSGIFGDSPCVSWPTAPPEGPRPAPFAPPDVPILTLNATGDSATPYGQGVRVSEALRGAGRDVVEVSVEGLHHVVWGSSNCADRVTSAFLFEPGAGPPRVSCVEPWLAPISGLAPDVLTAEDAAPERMATLVAAELAARPWFPGEVPSACPGGGRVVPAGDGRFRLEDCALFAGLVLTGDGEWDEDENVAVKLDLRDTGPLGARVRQ